MDLLIPDSGLLFWMTLVFIIVFIILWKAGFPAIIKMVTDRKAYIDESLRKAHEANEKLANIQKEIRFWHMALINGIIQTSRAQKLPT